MQNKFLLVYPSDIYKMSHHPQAFWMFLYLLDRHEQEHEFTIPQKQTARRLDWDKEEVKKCIRTLSDQKKIKQTYFGGGERGAHKYEWLDKGGE